MTFAKPMLESHPRDFDLDTDVLAGCIEACYGCAQACTACADDCLSEEAVQDLVRCVRLCLDCADICAAAGRVANRRTGYDANVTRGILDACVTACRACGDECEEHAGHHEHCRICAEACRACEQACRELLAAIA